MIDPQDMTRKYGALDLTVVGSHTEQEWLELLAQWNWKCFYCAEPVQRNSSDLQHEATKDHMLPISRGGVDFIGNIVPACLRCNQLKSDSTVEEFRSQRAWVLDRKSTGITPYAAPNTFPQQQNSQTVEIEAPAPPLPTIEIAAMWKRVVDAAATRKTFDTHPDHAFWERRRSILKTQAQRMQPMRRLEALGQQVLPIFGTGEPRKLMETEPAELVVSNGMHVAEPSRRKA